GFPPPKGVEPAPTKGLSWRVALLPYVEQDVLYKQFNMNEPWDGPTNKPLLNSMPKIYQVPGRPAPPGQTYYQVFVTPQQPRSFRTAFPALGPGQRVTGIIDGTSNTFMVVEMANPVPWTAPDDPVWEPGKTPPLGVYKGGFNALMCDGSVRWVSST